VSCLTVLTETGASSMRPLKAWPARNYFIAPPIRRRPDVIAQNRLVAEELFALLASWLMVKVSPARRKQMRTTPTLAGWNG